MPRKKYDQKYLLGRSDTLDILQIYLIKGIENGIRFSEFLHVLEDDISHPKEFFIDRKSINKDRLKTRLKHLMREDILYQDKRGDSYFLKEKWYNFPVKILIKNIIEGINLNQYYFPMENLGLDEKPCFQNIEVILGLENKDLSDDYKEEVDNLIINIKVITSRLFDLKLRIIEEEGEKTLNAFYKLLSEKEKVIWSAYKNNMPSFYKDLTHSSMSLLSMLSGESPSERTISSFYINKPKGIRNLIVRAIIMLNGKLVRFYPFSTGIVSFFDLIELDLGVFSDVEVGQLSYADAYVRFRSKNLKEFYDSRIRENEKSLEYFLNHESKDSDEVIQELIIKLDKTKKKYEGLRNALTEKSKKRTIK